MKNLQFSRELTVFKLPMYIYYIKNIDSICIYIGRERVYNLTSYSCKSRIVKEIIIVCR